jgi:hypothetical protein
VNWEQWFCSDRACSAEAWIVWRDSAASEVWLVAAHMNDRPFTVAATEPVCPRCGTTLCLPVQLADCTNDNILEAGKLLEFVRSLPG